MERVVTASPHHKLATADRGGVEEGQGRRGEGEGREGEGNEEWMTGKGGVEDTRQERYIESRNEREGEICT